MNVKVLIGVLLAAEVVMLAKGGGLHAPSAGPRAGMSLASFGKPQVVDRKWAAAMAKKAAAETQAETQKSRHRIAVDACIGPSGPSMSPSRYDRMERQCEAKLAAAAAAPAETDTPPPTYHIGPPPPVAQAPETVSETVETGT